MLGILYTADRERRSPPGTGRSYPPPPAATLPQAEPQDSVQVFADALRSKGGIENRAAVLQGQRFELFRGKDLVRWVKAHPERGAAAAAGAADGGCRLLLLLAALL